MTEVGFIKPATDVDAVLPVQPVGWRVLIRCYEVAETSEHGILFAEETRESEDLLSYVGKIVAMGSECYKLTTRSGIKMADIDPKPKVGDWIMYGTYGGQKVITKAGAKYLIMNDDGIMGIVKDPASFRAYL